jgi:hypothetical protein
MPTTTEYLLNKKLGQSNGSLFNPCAKTGQSGPPNKPAIRHNRATRTPPSPRGLFLPRTAALKFGLDIGRIGQAFTGVVAFPAAVAGLG